ncbi:hypothetical protein PIB30_088849 [Stylosanthes scabra]|uniref:Uncharacterized protein n=1 Tax=Stylosanthes scabra TaxID=79078 RepID=A0ABU6WVR2_9FABA|nr:hypothetical protein [Stylosanthes scabra]
MQPGSNVVQLLKTRGPKRCNWKAGDQIGARRKNQGPKEREGEERRRRRWQRKAAAVVVDGNRGRGGGRSKKERERWGLREFLHCRRAQEAVVTGLRSPPLKGSSSPRLIVPLGLTELVRVDRERWSERENRDGVVGYQDDVAAMSSDVAASVL